MSDVNTAIDKLIAESSISKSRRIRELIPQIEKAVDAGVRMKAIHEKLVENGLDISFETFRTSFYRARKKAKLAINRQPQQKALSKEDRIKLKEKMASDAALAKPKTLNWDPHKKINY